MNLYNEPKLFALKWMNESHISDVVEIERQCFPFPWSHAEFRRAIHGPCKGKIALLQGRIIGYMVWDTRRRGLHVLNLAVHPVHQRRGFARFMLRHLQNKLRSTTPNYRWINAMCREDNQPAIGLFMDMGFIALGVERSPFDAIDTDGIVFQWERELRTQSAEQQECCGK